VEHYLSIEKVRMGARLSYSIDVPADLRAAIVPPLSVEILAENAVRHGLSPRKEGGSVGISASREGGTLRITVVDDGVGLGGRTSGTGFGLLSVRQRLDLLTDGRGRLEVTREPGGGTRAVLEIPE
jgi:sensor histidine kinase YesM